MPIRYLSGLSVDSTVLVVDAANDRVGIGTASPSSKLEVNVGTDQNVAINSTGGIARISAYDDAVTNSVPLIINGSDLIFTNNVSEAVRITGGNVGIGTTNPGAKLTLSTPNAYDGTILQLQSRDEPTAYNLKINEVVTAGVVQWSFDMTNSSAYNNVLVFDRGNVGIGTASPATKLEVSSSLTSGIKVTNSGTINGEAGIEAYHTGAQAGTAYAGYITKTGAGGTNVGIYTAASGATNNYGLIVGSGNVGIGTDSPGDVLDVRKNQNATTQFYFRNTDTTDASSRAYFNLISGDTSLTLAALHGLDTYIAGTSGRKMYFQQNIGGTVNMVIDSTGNVGIGTTSPDRQLQIHESTSGTSTAKFTNSTTGEDGDTGFFVGINGSEQPILYGYNNTDMIIGTNGSERMRITSAGALLVGTTSTTNTASGKIVNRTTGSSNPDLALNGGAWSIASVGGEPALYLSSNIAAATGIPGATQTAKGGIGFEYVNAAAPTDIVLGIFGAPTVASSVRIFNNTERMRITSAGNVGIGTDNPSGKLHVDSGDIVLNNTYSLYLNSSISDGNWRVQRSSAPNITRSLVSGASLNLYSHFGTGEGFVIGANGGNSYYEILGSGPTHFFRGNVGIGIANPGSYDSNADNLVIGSVGENDKNGITIVGGDTDGRGAIYFADTTQNSAGYITYKHVDNSMLFGTSDSTALTLASTGAATFSSSVTAAGNSVVIRGAGLNNTVVSSTTLWADTAPLISIYNSSTTANTAAGFQMQVGGGSAIAGVLGIAESTSQAAMGLFTGGSGTVAEKMRITSAGNVGIGTTAPSVYTGYTTLSIDNSSSGGLLDLRNNGTSALRLSADSTTQVSIFGATSVPMVFSTNGSEKMRLNASGNLSIGNTNDTYKLDVSGTSSFSGVITFAGNTRYGVSKVYNASIGDMFGMEQVSSVQTGTGAATRIFADDATDNYVSLGKYTNATDFTDLFKVRTDNGRATLGVYGSGTITGTPAYNLAVDSSGNIIELPGGVVDGSGTANYVTKWQDANTVTNSQMFDNGTNVGINNATPKTKLDINGTIGFGSKSLNISDTFATVLTVNMSNHTGCYVKITAFGDWSGHSAVAYLGEFFLQNGASAYNEPGVIIRQVDNTNTDDVVAQIVDPAGTGTRDFEIQLKTTSASGVPFTAYLQYEVRGQYNSVS
jgi:hypothetical protein